MAQKRLIGINGVNQCREFFGEHQCLTTGSAACIDYHFELAPREQPESPPCVNVTSRAQLAHSPKEQIDGVTCTHPRLPQ